MSSGCLAFASVCRCSPPFASFARAMSLGVSLAPQHFGDIPDGHRRRRIGGVARPVPCVPQRVPYARRGEKQGKAAGGRAGSLGLIACGTSYPRFARCPRKRIKPTRVVPNRHELGSLADIAGVLNRSQRARNPRVLEHMMFRCPRTVLDALEALLGSSSRPESRN